MKMIHWKRVAIAVTISSLITGLAVADLKGSKHDFTRAEWSEGDGCGACHVPHQSQMPKAAPLWDPDADLERTFGTPPQDIAPGNGTLMCIRCHDGTIARDTIPTETRKTRFVYTQHPGLFSTGHGTSDHPVGIKFPNIDSGFHPANIVTADGAVTLPDDRVECISCHDPHNQSGVDKMLVKSNKGSALCLTCHNK